MTKILVSFSAMLMLLLILGKFFAKPLLAQVRAVLVADIDTPARVPYQTWLHTNCKDGDFECELFASPVPAGKRLTITHVSGLFQIRSQAGQVLVVSLDHGVAQIPNSTRPPYAAPVYLPTFFQGTKASIDEFVVNTPVLAQFDPPDSPRIFVDLGTFNITGSASFALSGYVVDCAAAPCAPITF
jgi:hypothetical protein